MDSFTALEIGRQSVFVLLKVATPLMIVALLVGLAISLFQALTQIQEMTLAFVPKIIAIFVSLLVLLPYMGEQLSLLAQTLNTQIITGGFG